MEPSIAFLLYAFFACFAFTSAADSSVDGTPVGTLYAYGKNISGMPLFYADGKALLGYGQPEDSSTSTNLTFINSNSNTLVSSPNKTDLASNWASPVLYIDTNKGSFSEVGFTSSSNTSYTTSGFRFWGRILIWTGESDDDSVGRSFWAAPRGDDGLWTLLWNSDNTASDTAIPVVLKRQPPPAIEDK